MEGKCTEGHGEQLDGHLDVKVGKTVFFRGEVLHDIDKDEREEHLFVEMLRQKAFIIAPNGVRMSIQAIRTQKIASIL